MIARILLVIYLIACSCIVKGNPEDLQRSKSVPPESCLPEGVSDLSPSGSTPKSVAMKLLQRTKSTAVRLYRHYILGYGSNARVDSDNNCFVQYQLSARSWKNIRLKRQEGFLVLPESTGKPRLLMFLHPRNKVPDVQIRYSIKLPLFGTSRIYGTLNEASTEGILRDEAGVNKKLYLVYNPGQQYLFVTAQDDDTMLVYFDITNDGIRASDYSKPRAGGATLAAMFSKIESTLYNENFRTTPIDWGRIHSLPQYADFKGDYQPKDKKFLEQAREIAQKTHDMRLWLQNDIESGTVDMGSVEGFPPAFQPLIPFAYMNDGVNIRAELSRQTSYEISNEFRGSKGANAAARSSVPPSMETTRIHTTDWLLIDDAVKLQVEKGIQVHIIVRVNNPVGIKVHVDLSNEQPGPVYARDFVQDSYLIPQQDDVWCIAFPLDRDLVKQIPDSNADTATFLPIYYRISIMEPGNGLDLQTRDDAAFVTPGSSPTHPLAQKQLLKQPTKSWTFTPPKKGCFTKATFTDVKGRSRKCELTEAVDFFINYSFGVSLFPEVTVMKPPVAGAPAFQSTIVHATWLGVVTPLAYSNYLYEKNTRIPSLVQVKQLGSPRVGAISQKSTQGGWQRQTSIRRQSLDQEVGRLGSGHNDRAQVYPSNLNGGELGQRSGPMSRPVMESQVNSQGDQNQVGETGHAL